MLSVCTFLFRKVPYVNQVLEMLRVKRNICQTKSIRKSDA
jgi:hypothetical protein